jgi:hypothetical protein
MERGVELGGFFAAHGIWCVSGGEALIPMLAEESSTSGRTMQRFAADQLEQGVEQAQAHLASNPNRADWAALIYDGYITLPSGRTDALFVVIRTYKSPEASLTMAVPYRNAASPNGFAVYRPKFIKWQGASEPDYQAFGQAFFTGVESHNEGFATWNRALDESI